MTEPTIQHQQPPVGLVWAFSFIAVTVVSCCSLIGLILVPYLRGPRYRILINYFTGLAVGSLTGSAFFNLIPETFELSLQKAGKKDYLYKALVIFVGLYFFYLAERFLRIWFDHKSQLEQKRDRKTSIELPSRVHSESIHDNGEPVRPTIAEPQSPSISSGGIRSTQVDTTPVVSRRQTVDADSEPRPSLPKSDSKQGEGIKQASGDEPKLSRHPSTASRQQPVKQTSEDKSQSTQCSSQQSGVDSSADVRQSLLSDTGHLRTPDRQSGNVVDLTHGHGPHGHGSHLLDTPELLTRAWRKSEDTGVPASDRIKPIAWMIIIGDALHNFVDGLSIGAGFADKIPLGLTTTISVVFEELPHELGDFAVLISSGMTVRAALIANFASACTCYIGMVFGILVGAVPSMAIYIFAIASGMFLYIALVDMMGELVEMIEKKKTTPQASLVTLAIQNSGILTGITLIWLLAFFT